MSISDLVAQLRNEPSNVDFKQVMQVISQFYAYAPIDFTNGELLNKAGTNEGSCKIFYFAQLNKLTEQETLYLFGTYYRDDVLANPEGNDHGNIRNFISTGWAGIKFDAVALTQL